MEKFQLPSEYDTEQLQELVRIFPQFWRESYFDFDEFKAYISGIVPDDLQEKYSFTWHGKAESYRLLKKNSNGTLRPCKEDSVNWDSTQNLYIEGDNLEVLKLIKHTYAGERGVKMIYIDPPYNTSEDFIYDDNFMDSLDKYLEYTNQKGIAMPEVSGRYHTRWLNMMYPRLWLANYLFRDDGVIFISIDDREITNLRKLCDEVFGEENFVCQFVWKSKLGKVGTTSTISSTHEYILCYGKQAELLNFKMIENENDGRRENLRQWGQADRREDRPSMFYPIVIDGVEVYPIKDDGSEGRWRVGQETAKELLEQDMLELVSRDGNSQIYRNFEAGISVTAYETLLLDDIGTTAKGSITLRDLGLQRAFDYSKPIELVKHFARLCTSSDDIILDFFSGSGTTAHATMQLNAEDGGNRRFIMIQIPEVINEKHIAFSQGYKAITEIGKERIRRAGAEIAKTYPNVDTGFRVFKLDKSNFKIWDDTPVDPKNPSEVARLMGQLELHADSPFIDGRTHEDIVYEIMRMNNYTLTTPITPIEINGETVYGIGEDCDFIICIDVTIDEAAAEELCTYRPGRILFTDNCFKNTETRVNVEHTIKNINERIKLRVV